MKVLGLGSPDELRVRVAHSEREVLVGVLRNLRAGATRAVATVYESTPPERTRQIDDRHDHLRAIDALLVQVDQHGPNDRTEVVVVGDTELMRIVIHDSAREAIRLLQDAHASYEERLTPKTAAALIAAARAALAWTETLIAADRVDLGWPQHPCTGDPVTDPHNA